MSCEKERSRNTKNTERRFVGAPPNGDLQLYTLGSTHEDLGQTLVPLKKRGNHLVNQVTKYYCRLILPRPTQKAKKGACLVKN